MGPRCIALVGPFQSGKTTLLEAILARTGAIQRQGTVDAGTTVGDASKEARHHKMSVEASVATTSFMGDSYTFIDCPGSVEFIHDMRGVLPAVDAAVVVCEADEKKVPQLQLILRELEDQNIPRFLFLNKIDKADKRVRDTLKLLQPASRVPLLLRQIPIWTGDIITGFVDLALERAYVYKEHAPSGDRRAQGRGPRPRERSALHHAGDARRSRRRADGAIARGHPAAARQGVRRSRQGIARRSGLSGAARRRDPHQRRAAAAEGAAPRGAGRRAKPRKRLGVKAGSDAVAYVLKTFHTAHGGKMSVARVLSGPGRRRHDAS